MPARGRLLWKVGWTERGYAFILTTYSALLIVCGKNVYMSFHLGLLWTQGNFSVHTLGTLNFSPLVADACVPCLLPHICVSKTTHRKAVNAAPGCQAAVELPSTEGAGGDHRCAFLCSCLRGWMTSGRMCLPVMTWGLGVRLPRQDAAVQQNPTSDTSAEESQGSRGRGVAATVKLKSKCERVKAEWQTCKVW